MSTVLIAYGTTEGQTAKIADVIAEVLRERGTRRMRSTSGPSPTPSPPARTP